MDRISNLPDHVLSHIISKLSIKDMVKTSVLSRAWSRDLWSLGRDLNFDEHGVLGSEEEVLEAGYVVGNFETNSGRAEFVNRVDQFFKNYPDTQIDSFNLSFNLNCEQSSSIDQWISFAILRGVRRIDLLLSPSIMVEHINSEGDVLWSVKPASTISLGAMHKFYKFPWSLFESNNASNLRSLKLEEASIDETLMTRCLLKCPRLEELRLEYCFFKSSTVKIASSSLRHLGVTYCVYKSNKSLSTVKLDSLDCPKLTWLECNICGLGSSSINIPVVKRISHSAYTLSETSNAIALFANLPQLEILDLNINYFKVVPRPLNHLRELNLIWGNWHEASGYFGAPKVDVSCILPIIQTSPHLKKLSVVFHALSFSSGDQKDIEDHETFSHEELKVVEIGGCVGNWYEIELAVNVLRHVRNLERLVLSPYSKKQTCVSDRAWFQNTREIREKLEREVVGRTQLILVGEIDDENNNKCSNDMGSLRRTTRKRKSPKWMKDFV